MSRKKEGHFTAVLFVTLPNKGFDRHMYLPFSTHIKEKLKLEVSDSHFPYSRSANFACPGVWSLNYTQMTFWNKWDQLRQIFYFLCLTVEHVEVCGEVPWYFKLKFCRL